MSTLPQHDLSDATRLIVCEKSGAWANLLRRNLTDAGRWIVETRSLGQLLESAGEHKTSLVLIEVTDNNVHLAASCIDELRRQAPHTVLTTIIPPMNAASPKAPHLTPWMLRELGVQVVISSPRDISTLRRLWSRHCRLHPPHEQTLREQVFQKLPWAMT